MDTTQTTQRNNPPTEAEEPSLLTKTANTISEYIGASTTFINDWLSSTKVEDEHTQKANEIKKERNEHWNNTIKTESPLSERAKSLTQAGRKELEVLTENAKKGKKAFVETKENINKPKSSLNQSTNNQMPVNNNETRSISVPQEKVTVDNGKMTRKLPPGYTTRYGTKRVKDVPPAPAVNPETFMGNSGYIPPAPSMNEAPRNNNDDSSMHYPPIPTTLENKDHPFMQTPSMIPPPMPESTQNNNSALMDNADTTSYPPIPSTLHNTELPHMNDTDIEINPQYASFHFPTPPQSTTNLVDSSEFPLPPSNPTVYSHPIQESATMYRKSGFKPIPPPPQIPTDESIYKTSYHKAIPTPPRMDGKGPAESIQFFPDDGGKLTKEEHERLQNIHKNETSNKWNNVKNPELPVSERARNLSEATWESAMFCKEKIMAEVLGHKEKQ